MKELKKLDSWISIHALRGEGDKIKGSKYATGQNFNPRPPWGGRPVTSVLIC